LLSNREKKAINFTSLKKVSVLQLRERKAKKSCFMIRQGCILVRELCSKMSLVQLTLCARLTVHLSALTVTVLSD
jgi:hypothetical protein